MSYRVVKSLSDHELTSALFSVNGRLFYIQELIDPNIGARRGLIRRMAIRKSLRSSVGYFRSGDRIDIHDDGASDAASLHALISYVEQVIAPVSRTIPAVSHSESAAQ